MSFLGGSLGSNNSGLLNQLGVVIDAAANGLDVNGSLNQLRQAFEQAGHAVEAAGAAPFAPHSTPNFSMSDDLGKMLFMAALGGAMRRAAAESHFDLESALADLMTSLAPLRPAKSETSDLSKMIGQQQQVFQILQNMLGQYEQAAKTIPANIGN